MECEVRDIKESIKEQISQLEEETLWIIYDFINALIQ